MEKTAKVLVEELALEGPYGATWVRLTELVRSRDESCFIFNVSDENLLAVREALMNSGVISKGRGENYILNDPNIRYQILGVGTLPVIYEMSQNMRLLELIARGRGTGAWSFNLSSALGVDAKQLFHLANSLVDYGLVYRKSSIPIPRKYRTPTTGTGSSATFFIHSKFASCPTDPEISEIVQDIDSSDSVVMLIQTLLRESGGIVTAKTLQRTVCVVGGFLPQTYRRGRQKLIDNGRVEAIFIPSRPEEKQEDISGDDDEDREDKKHLASGLVRAYKLVDRVQIIAGQQQSVEVKEDPSAPSTPEELEEDAETNMNQSLPVLRMQIQARNLIKANYSFTDSLRVIIRTSGSDGVTTSDLSRITGIPPKEIAKVLETLRTEPNIYCEWKNERRKKFLVYKWTLNKPIELKDEDGDAAMLNVSGTPTPPLTPMSAFSSGSGYVTAATIRRSGYVAEILAGRGGALSMIDLGRAIEAKELAEGTGIPNTTIDRRTLRKICDISNFPVIEKTLHNSQLPSNTTKLMIVYDPKILSAEQAAQKIDRPVGLVPKTETVRQAAAQPAAPKKVEFTSIHEIQRKSRLAAIAIFGDEQSAKVPVSVQVATIYGYITADIYKARILHGFLVSSGEKFTQKFRLQFLINELDLSMYLKVLGCGVLSKEIDSAFNDENNNTLTMRIADIEKIRPALRAHLRSSLMGGHGTESSHMSRILLPLVRLGLLQVDKDGYTLGQVGVIPGIPAVGESVEINVSNSDGVEEFWRVLYRYCTLCRHVGPPVDPGCIYNTFPGLTKMNQWRSKMVVSLTQRRALEKFLRSLIELKTNLVVDGSNEELVRLCVDVKLEVAVALKALSGLLKVIGDDRAKQRIVFAHVMQARFCCHVCGKIFYQFHSVQAHYQSVHGAIDVPDDKEMYTRQEYMEAVEKLRRGPVKSTKRNRRTRGSTRGQRTSDTRRSKDENFEEFENQQEERDWKESVDLAKQFGGTNIGRDQLWRLVAQIRGIESVPEMIIQKLTREATPAPQVLSVTEFPVSDQYKVVANMLVFNRVVVDSDISVLQGILSENKMDVEVVANRLRAMHAEGLLAIERSAKSMMSSSSTFESPLLTRTYTPSRVLKTKLFGKYTDIEKFLKLFSENKVSEIVEAEEAIEGMANAKNIISELYFDIGSVDEIDEDENEEVMDGNDDDENISSRQTNSYTGIKKHLALSRDAIGGDISRVEVAGRRYAGQLDSIRRAFFRDLVENFGTSNLWRPVKTESNKSMSTSEVFVDFNEPSNLKDLGHRVGVANLEEQDVRDALADLSLCSPQMIRVLEILQLITVTIEGEPKRISESNDVWFMGCGRETTSFGRLMSSLDLRWNSFYFSPWEGGLNEVRKSIGVETKPRMSIASFTSADGVVNEQLIRDIMLSALYNIYTAPGQTIEDLNDRLGGILRVQEIELILTTLSQLKLVYQDDDQWFMEPNSE